MPPPHSIPVLSSLPPGRSWHEYKNGHTQTGLELETLGGESFDSAVQPNCILL